MHIQNCIKIHPFVLKILRKNTFLYQSWAITLLFINEFSPFAIANHSFLISMSMQSLKKIGQKLLNLSREMTFLHQSRAITMMFINKFSPFAIPKHSSPISMSMQSLKKIGQKLQVRVRKRRADRRMDVQTLKIYPLSFSCPSTCTYLLQRIPNIIRHL